MRAISETDNYIDVIYDTERCTCSISETDR